MNQEEMYKTINKGIPNFVDIEISIPVMTNQCASDYNLLIEELRQHKLAFREFLIKTMGYTKANDYFFRGFTTRTFYKNSENVLFVSSKPFIIRLKNIMGVDDPSEDFNDLDLKNKLLARLEVLKSITTKEELQREFPIIYTDYELSVSALEKINRIQNPSIKQEQMELYRTYALDADFTSFMRKQCIMYRNFIIRRQFVEDTSKHPIKLAADAPEVEVAKFEGLDKDKFELYLADRYLLKAEKSEDLDEIQRCVYYIATYVREPKKEDITIINDESKKVTYNSILKRYRALLKKYRTIRPLEEPRENFKNYHKKHVENHMKKYYGFLEDWVLIPEGEDEAKKDQVDERTQVSLSHKNTHLSKEEQLLKAQERLALLAQKKDFFNGTNPETKLYGLNSFNGYIAHVYKNGKVLLEKFYEDLASYIPAQDEAIYVLDVNNFEELSKLSKPVLIRDHHVKRIIHRGEWEERCRSIIDIPATPADKEDIQRLILKCQKK